MSDILQFILDYIQTEYDIPADIDVNTFNYVKTGYVDSMGVIRFVVELEERFGIVFSDEELADPAFQVIGLLAEMVRKKVEQSL